MILSKRISLIRKVSLNLFIFSFFSLVLSLLLHNAIVSFKFKKILSDEEIGISKFYSKKINCSKNIDDCKKKFLGHLSIPKKLGDCYIYNFERELIFDGKKLKKNDIFQKNHIGEFTNLKPKFINKEIELRIIGYDKNDECIKNSKFYYLYKIFPFYHEFIYSLKTNPKTQTGSTVAINPFINGETSISNIAKRFPVNFIFKSFLFISVFLMYLYWINYKNLFIVLLTSKNNKFIYFGLASAFFLFFHVLLLGVEFDNKIFKIIRKLIIVFFILSEIIAQSLLSIKLFNNKKNFNNFCNSYIINIKLCFVVLIGFVSTLVIIILLFYDFSNKIDYILEWNYFVILLFYYFLSFMMWKKN